MTLHDAGPGLQPGARSRPAAGSADLRRAGVDGPARRPRDVDGRRRPRAARARRAGRDGPRGGRPGAAGRARPAGRAARGPDRGLRPRPADRPAPARRRSAAARRRAAPPGSGWSKRPARARRTRSGRWSTCARTPRRTPRAAPTGGWPPTWASWRPAARSAPTTCSASAAPRSRWPAARSGRRSGRVLDVGTGCGVQALHAARHADAVVATDLSGAGPRLRAAQPRAERRPRGATCARGDLLEPARGELFDLVVSNPPFVITPRTPAAPAYTYRTAGWPATRSSGGSSPASARCSRPGGVAQLLGNWEDRAGEPLEERVGGVARRVRARRLGGAARAAGPGAVRGALDARRRRSRARRDEPSSTRRGSTTSPRASVEAHRLRPRHAAAPGRRAAPTLRRVEDLLGPLEEPVGEHVAGLPRGPRLAAGARRRRAAGRAAAGRRGRDRGALPPPRRGGPRRSILLRQGGGFGRVVRASTALAGLVGACDGELPVGAIAAALAHLLDEPVGELTGRLLPAVRGLVADGLLLPEPAQRPAWR